MSTKLEQTHGQRQGVSYTVMGAKHHLLFHVCDTGSEGLEEDKLEVGFGGSDQGDGVAVPGCSLKLGSPSSSFQQRLCSAHNQTRSPLPEPSPFNS